MHGSMGEMKGDGDANKSTTGPVAVEKGKGSTIKSASSTTGKKAKSKSKADRLCAWCESENPRYQCTGCKRYSYCSKACQIVHYNRGHKNECESIRCALASEAQRTRARRAAFARSCKSDDDSKETNAVSVCDEKEEPEGDVECAICFEVIDPHHCDRRQEKVYRNSCGNSF